MDNPAKRLILNHMKADTDILIAGGGLNGAALALAAAQAGLTVTIVDPTSENVMKGADFDGRGYALSLGSQRLLQALGIWKEIDSDTQPILEIKVSDGRLAEGPSPFVLEFDHAEIEDGPMGFMAEDRYLRRALLNGIAETPGITSLFGQSVTDHQVLPGAIRVTLSSGKTVTAAALIGSDGRKSGVAERAGIKRSGWDYDQTALVCAIEHQLPHHGIAHQYFLPPGPLAILPLPANRSSIVWTETRAEAARISTLDDAGYLQELRPRFGDFLGPIRLAGHRFSYDLNLSLANTFLAERIALIGDAAHGLHPIAGQGLNAGLKDVATLAEVLVTAKRRGEDIGRADVLERYQQWRRFDTATLAIATDGFNKLFSNDNSLVRLARDFGLGLVNSMPGVRRSFIREAAGLSGNIPKLLRGQQI